MCHSPGIKEVGYGLNLNQIKRNQERKLKGTKLKHVVLNKYDRYIYVPSYCHVSAKIR